jgi:alkylation response protein AidB-like acyl-CoA dehydrogenase
VNDTLARVSDLAPTIIKRAEEIERTRRLPGDLIGSLTEAGCLRMLVPSRHGGDELPLVESLRVLEELARADGSTGWVIGQVALSHLVFACFPERAREEIYAAGPDVFGAGAVAPKGRAAQADAEWRVNGQWPFVTGCVDASWTYLNCIVLDGHRPRQLPDGTPLTRIVCFPTDELEILDTWQALGLRGTASHDVRVSGQTCPDWRGFSLVGDGPGERRALFSIAQAGLLIAAVGLGIASGAVNEVAEFAAAGRRRAFSPRMLAASPVFQDRLGEAHLSLRAARALLHDEAAQAWARASAGEVAAPVERACLRATAAKVTSMAVEAIDAAHALAGGAAAYESSPLPRRLRDIHTATQHFVNGRDFYATVGALLVGADVDPNSY